MKVIAINGSSRKDANTAMIINTVLNELKDNDIETEMIQLANDFIEPCHACFTCSGKEKCSFHKDKFNEIFEKIVQADGIVLGSPVYSADVSSNMKAFIDRASVVSDMNPGMFKHKVGASVVACRRGGAIHAIETLNHFFLNKEMYLVGSTYWNMVYGQMLGDVFNDEEGIKNMKNIGQNMVYLLKK